MYEYVKYMQYLEYAYCIITEQSTYRGVGEIVGVYLPSQLERPPQLCL
jgi:hypothetical protein